MKTLLRLVPIALILIAGCSGDDPVEPGPDKGIVVVRIDPDTLDAGWTLDGPNGYELAGAGEMRLTERDPGSYTVTWDHVLDWIEPDPDTLTLAAGDSVVFTGTYNVNPDPVGNVVIDPEPNLLNPGWVLKVEVGDGAHDREGSGDATFMGIPVGPLTIDWTPITGYATPLPFEDAYLEGGATVTFSTTYTLQDPWPRAYVDVTVGAFAMGSPESEPGAQEEEWPRHAVTLTQDILAGETEVTVAQWDDVMGGGKTYDPTEANLPKTLVSWYDAVDYCNALSAVDGLTPAYAVDGLDVTWDEGADGWRLPTEAEWEYLCRAGTVTATSAGELQELSCDVDPVHSYYAWTCANSGGVRRHVRSLYPNDWGFYDVHGNVEEWCWDYFDADYYDVSPGTDPTGPATGFQRSVRGGNYAAWAQVSRSAARRPGTPGQISPAVGFRVVRTVTPTKAGAR